MEMEEGYSEKEESVHSPICLEHRLGRKDKRRQILKSRLGPLGTLVSFMVMGTFW